MTNREHFREILPEASEAVIDWLTLTFDTLVTQLGYKGIPHNLVRDLLPILAGLEFDWPFKDEMKIRPRLKK